MKINSKKIRKFLLPALLIFLFARAEAQVPQLIHFQAIARDGNGNLIIKQNIQIRLSIIDSGLKKIVYQETQAPILTDTFGYFDIKLNDSTNPDWTPSSKYGTFTSIPWATGHKWLLIEYQAPATFSYSTIGEVELVTYPYAMVAQTAISVQGFNIANAHNGDVLKYNASTQTWGPAPSSTLNAGSGITISNDSIINTSPDQTVTILGTGGTTVTGTYPNYTISSTVYNAGSGIRISNDSIINSSPNLPVTITGSGGTTVAGSYPNYIVKSTAYAAGSNISIKNDTISAASEVDTSNTTTAASNFVFGNKNPAHDSESVYATAPSDGLYLILGRATVKNESSYVTEAYLYLQNKTQGVVYSSSDAITTCPINFIQTGFPQTIQYLHKGDQIELAYDLFSGHMYYGFPGDNVILVKLK